ncbi:MAG: hypothetical protein RIS43_1075 [Actinomycetota bacterium]
MPNESRQRTTRQKTAIVEALNQYNEFLSAQQWHQLLKDSGQEIGLSTVYRTLTALSELGEVDVLMREDGEALYRSCSDAHHHHLMCRECGKTVEIAANEVEAWAAAIARQHKFTEIHHVVELSGLCQECN